MMLEKNYYSEEEKLWKDAEMEVKEHKNKSSSDTGDFLEFFKDNEGDFVAEKISEEKCKTGTACRYVSRERFSELTEEASCIAASAPMDIEVTSDQTGGQIRMSADCLLIMPSAPERMRRALSDLIQESEYFGIIPKNENLIEMHFWFSISQESCQ